LAYWYDEPGQGTTFKIYLPLRTEAVASAAEAPEPVRSKGGKNILVEERTFWWWKTKPRYATG
jgi:hypothetical protein